MVASGAPGSSTKLRSPTPLSLATARSCIVERSAPLDGGPASSNGGMVRRVKAMRSASSVRARTAASTQ